MFHNIENFISFAVAIFTHADTKTLSVSVSLPFLLSRLKKSQKRENDEEEELARLLNEIYRCNSHNDSHRTMMALKSAEVNR